MFLVCNKLSSELEGVASMLNIERRLINFSKCRPNLLSFAGAELIFPYIIETIDILVAMVSSHIRCNVTRLTFVLFVHTRAESYASVYARETQVTRGTFHSISREALHNYFMTHKVRWNSDELPTAFLHSDSSKV